MCTTGSGLVLCCYFWQDYIYIYIFLFGSKCLKWLHNFNQCIQINIELSRVCTFQSCISFALADGINALLTK